MATTADSSAASDNGVVKSPEVTDNESLQKALASILKQGEEVQQVNVQELIQEMMSPPCHEQTWELVKAGAEMQRRVDKLLNIIMGQAKLIDQLQKAKE